MWLPLLLTVAVLRFIIGLLDSILTILPHAYQPEEWLGVSIPGFGIIIALLLLLITGILGRNFLGQYLVIWGEKLLAKIPFVSSIYNASKQLIHAIFSSNSQSFRKVVLIEYPKQGLWTIAFLTGYIDLTKNGAEKCTVFVPTTPNPTSGFMILVEKTAMTELDMTVDAALKLIISLGVMQPVVHKKPKILKEA